MRSDLTVPALLLSAWAEESRQLEDFKTTEYYSLLEEAFEKLDTGSLYKSRIHGYGHIERVMLLGALIAWQEKLDPTDTELLLCACSYHDIGRQNDSVDDAHGRRSARMLLGARFSAMRERFSDSDLLILQSMITAHSLPDRKKREVAERFGVPEEDLARCEELTACLKDADNLDRVRLYDLDPKHLRHASSLSMVSFAESLFYQYTEMQRRDGT